MELPEICQWFLGLGIFAVVLGLVFLFFHLSLWLEGVFLICCCFLVIPVSLIFGFVGLPLELEKVKTKLTSEQMKKVEAGIWFLTGVKRAHDLFESGCILESEILSVWFLRVEQGKELEQLCELRKSGVLS